MGFFTTGDDTSTNQSPFFEALNLACDLVMLPLRPDRIAFKGERDDIAFPASVRKNGGEEHDRFL